MDKGEKRPDVPLAAGLDRLSRRRLLQLGGMGAAGLALAACGSSGGSSGGTTAGTTGATTGGTTAGTTAGTAAGGQAKESIKVAWGYIGPTTDNGWTFTHDQGRKAAESALGGKMTTSFVENVPISAEAGQIFGDLASKNDMVIANTEYADFLSSVAKSNPNIKFMECDGHTFSDNEFAYYVTHHRPAYLLGVAGGMLAKGGKIGYIGAFATATAYNDVNGLLLGARSVNPSATVQAVMISSFFDPQKATQAANTLIDAGVEYLFAVMDEPSFLQVANDRGIWAATWNTDVRQFGPNAYVNTYDLQWGDFYTKQCQALLDGTWKAATEVDLIDLKLGAWGDKVPKDVQDAVAAVQQKFDAGSLEVYQGPLKDDKGNEKLKDGETIDDQGAYSINWAVEGVSGVT
jgi:basic membrane protein A and related proteins